MGAAIGAPLTAVQCGALSLAAGEREAWGRAWCLGLAGVRGLGGGALTWGQVSGTGLGVPACGFLMAPGDTQPHRLTMPTCG